MKKITRKAVAFVKGSLAQRSQKALNVFNKTVSSLKSINRDLLEETVEATTRIDNLVEANKNRKSVIDANSKVIRKIEDFLA